MFDQERCDKAVVEGLSIWIPLRIASMECAEKIDGLSGCHKDTNVGFLPSMSKWCYGTVQAVRGSRPQSQKVLNVVTIRPKVPCLKSLESIPGRVISLSRVGR